jgi:hypothetical protein
VERGNRRSAVVMYEENLSIKIAKFVIRAVRFLCVRVHACVCVCERNNECASDDTRFEWRNERCVGT